MSAAKERIQIAHGTDFVHMKFRVANPALYALWLGENQRDRRKIVLRIDNETKLRVLMDKLLGELVQFHEIWDRGFTEFEGETFTGIVIYPLTEVNTPKYIKRLRLV